MGIAFEKKSPFTCHPLRCPQEPNQPKNSLYKKSGLEGPHYHLLEEHKLFGFPELILEMLHGKPPHEACKYQKITQLSIIECHIQGIQDRKQIYT